MKINKEAAVLLALRLRNQRRCGPWTAYITETFKDPDSVKGLEIREPTKFIQKQKLDFGIWGSTENRTYGYLIFFRSNAKNSYGGYTGIHDFSLFVRNGTVLDSHDLTAEIQSLR